MPLGVKEEEEVVVEGGEDVVLGLVEVDFEVEVLEVELEGWLLTASAMVNDATLPESESVLTGAGEEALLTSV